MLNNNHKIVRIEYALHLRDSVDKRKYRDMYDFIHVDEKWFFITRDGECYILAHNETHQKE